MRWLVDEITRVQAPRSQMLEQACRYVMAIGYQPDECLIERYDAVSAPIDGVAVTRELLKVRGEPFFELTTTRRGCLDEFRIDFTYTPRVIAWPPVLDAPAAASTPMSGIPR